MPRLALLQQLLWKLIDGSCCPVLTLVWLSIRLPGSQDKPLGCFAFDAGLAVFLQFDVFSRRIVSDRIGLLRETIFFKRLPLIYELFCIFSIEKPFIKISNLWFFLWLFHLRKFWSTKRILTSFFSLWKILVVFSPFLFTNKRISIFCTDSHVGSQLLEPFPIFPKPVLRTFSFYFKTNIAGISLGSSPCRYWRMQVQTSRIIYLRKGTFLLCAYARKVFVASPFTFYWVVSGVSRLIPPDSHCPISQQMLFCLRWKYFMWLLSGFLWLIL